MQKKRFTLIMVLTLLFAIASVETYHALAAIYKDYVVSKQATGDQFDFPGNYTAPELTIDGVKDDEYQFLVNGGSYLSSIESSEESSYYSLLTEKYNFLVENHASKEGYIPQKGPSAMNVYAYRGDVAIYFFFEVLDTNLLTFANGPGDAVTQEDSIEFYIDPLLNGGNNPQTDDLQINIGLSGYTRKLQGTGMQWGTYAALMDFEFVVDGTLNNPTDVDNGYCVEIMIPYAQINANVGKNSPLGIAFGHVDKYDVDSSSSFTWTGIQHYDNVQTPSKYYVYDTDGTFYYSYQAYQNR